MRTLLAIAAMLCLQACTQADEDALGKSMQAANAPADNGTAEPANQT